MCVCVLGDNIIYVPTRKYWRKKKLKFCVFT